MKLSSNKILSAAVILLLVLNTVLLIMMWKGKEKHDTTRRSSGNSPFEMMVKELNLTEQQKNDYQKLRDEHLAVVRPLYDSIREVRKDFMRLVKEPNVSDNELSAYSARVAQKQAIIDKLTLEHLKKARALFSGDQQKRFDEFVQKMAQQRMSGGRRRDSTNNH